MVAVLGLLPMLLANTANLPLGEFRLQVLDVGQGSAALIDTRSHRIVVDAGPKIDTRFDAGRISRYGHPHPLVSNRYALECSRQLVTGLVGGITWSSADPERIFSQRLGSLTLAFAPGLHRLDESACAEKPTNPSVRRH